MLLHHHGDHSWVALAFGCALPVKLSLLAENLLSLSVSFPYLNVFAARSVKVSPFLFLWRLLSKSSMVNYSVKQIDLILTGNIEKTKDKKP